VLLRINYGRGGTALKMDEQRGAHEKEVEWGLAAGFLRGGDAWRDSSFSHAANLNTTSSSIDQIHLAFPKLFFRLHLICRQFVT